MQMLLVACCLLRLLLLRLVLLLPFVLRRTVRAMLYADLKLRLLRLRLRLLLQPRSKPRTPDAVVARLGEVVALPISVTVPTPGPLPYLYLCPPPNTQICNAKTDENRLSTCHPPT